LVNWLGVKEYWSTKLVIPLGKGVPSFWGIRLGLMEVCLSIKLIYQVTIIIIYTKYNKVRFDTRCLF